MRLLDFHLYQKFYNSNFLQHISGICSNCMAWNKVIIALTVWKCVVLFFWFFILLHYISFFFLFTLISHIICWTPIKLAMNVTNFLFVFYCIKRSFQFLMICIVSCKSTSLNNKSNLNRLSYCIFYWSVLLFFCTILE